MDGQTRLPAVRPPARPSAFGAIVPAGMRPSDPNAIAEQARAVRGLCANLGLEAAAIGSICLFLSWMGESHAVLASAVTMFIMSISTTFIFLTREPHALTPAHPPGMDPLSLPSLLRELARVAREGLTDRDRPRLQNLVDRSSEQVGHLLGADPWTFAQDPRTTGAGIYVMGVKLGADAGPESLGRRAMAIEAAIPAVDLVAAPGGTEPRPLRMALAGAIPRIRSVCEDFGVDPAGFAEPVRVLPGMRATAIAALPPLDAAARRLADEWAGGDRSGVDPSTALEADKAAGPELEALSRSWSRARASAAPEGIEAVDADMREGCRRICATLSAALSARARSDRDSLSVQARYLASKHPLAAE